VPAKKLSIASSTASSGSHLLPTYVPCRNTRQLHGAHQPQHTISPHGTGTEWNISISAPRHATDKFARKRCFIRCDGSLQQAASSVMSACLPACLCWSALLLVRSWDATSATVLLSTWQQVIAGWSATAGGQSSSRCRPGMSGETTCGREPACLPVGVPSRTHSPALPALPVSPPACLSHSDGPSWWPCRARLPGCHADRPQEGSAG
jgi:hypothetical protein